jgi:hypothetical protein
MHLVFRLIESAGGKKFDGLRRRRGRQRQMESLRGPAQIDAASRDLIENYYIRRVSKVDGKMKRRGRHLRATAAALDLRRTARSSCNPGRRSGRPGLTAS